MNGELVSIDSGESLYLKLIYQSAGCSRDIVELIAEDAQAGSLPSYSLRVGSCTINGIQQANGKLYAATLESTREVFIFVEVNDGIGYRGFYVFSYQQLGDKEYLTQLILVNGDLCATDKNSFTAYGSSGLLDPYYIRTYNTYVLCEGGIFTDTENVYQEAITLIPEGTTALGTITALKRDLYIYDKYADDPSFIITSGSSICICATDNDGWVLVEDLKTSVRGWIQIKDGIINGDGYISDYLLNMTYSTM